MSLPTLFVAFATLAAGVLLGVFWQRARDQSELRGKEKELVKAQTRLREREDADKARKQSLEAANKQFQDQLKSLASDALSQSQKNFLNLANESFGKAQEASSKDLDKGQQAIKALVEPISKNLEKTQNTLREMEKERAEAQGKLDKQIELMTESNEKLHAETGKLVKAFRRPEVRGHWGEMQLRKLVEIAGMQKHCDFVEQPQSSDGRTRPDMIVKLPEGGQLVVDVKTPMDAFLDAWEADDEDARGQLLDRHAANVVEQIRRLSLKEYWDQFERSPDFVIMFLPSDHFLAAAGDKQPSLMEDALRARVILATPASMMALLRVTAYGWRQLALAENAEKISKLAAELHKRVAIFSSHLGKLGKNLNTAIGTYNDAVGSFRSRFLPQIERMSGAGVEKAREIDQPEEVATGATVLLTQNEPAEKEPPDPGEGQ